jgi:hypothetical protein
MKTFALTLGIVLCAVAGARGAEVWTATFDADADGVVDIFDANLGKVMIGPAVGGRLQIEAWDNTTNQYTPDKAGRPLGATVDGQSSFSALYKFRWSTLTTDQTPQAYELAGFLGTGGAPQTRQVCGAIIRHWKVDPNYYAAVDLAFGSVGFTSFGYLAGPTIWLGTDPMSNDYQLVVGYDGSTHVQSVQLFDAIGIPLGGVTADLDTDVPGLQQFGTPAQEIGALLVDHLGWSDYTAYGGDRASIWQVDSLTYYDTADEAFDAAVVPSESWVSTFGVDGEFDGFVDVYDGPEKNMLNTNGALGGTLRVRQIDDDAWGSPYVPDKAGRAVGLPIGEDVSWSILYQFRWTGLPTQQAPVTYQFTGALGKAVPQTRQVVGCLITHWKVVNDYYTRLGLIVGGSGDQIIDQTMAPAYLGPNAETTDYQLAIGWDTTADTLSAQLYLADGTPLATTNGLPVSMNVPVPTDLVTNFNITHVGWGDYTGDAATVTNVIWEVDTVAFYLNDPAGAFDDAEGRLPGDIDGDGDVDLDDYLLFEACLAGPDVGTPPGPCPQADFQRSDLDKDLDVDVEDFSIFQPVFGS